MLTSLSFSLLVLVVWWVSYLYRTRQVIMDEVTGTPYLIRYFIWKPKSKGTGRIYLHHIMRSDHDRAKHSHPWKFTSLILWGGYTEVADIRQIRLHETGWKYYDRGEMKKWFGAGSLLRRGAGWRHKLVLPEGKTAWTLVKTSKKLNEWGFFIDGDKFCHWKKYDTGTGMCQEDDDV